MSMNALVGALRVALGMDSAQFEKGATDVERRMKRMRKSMQATGRQMQKIGQNMSVAVSVPMAAIGASTVAAAKSMIELDNMAKVAGVSAERMKVLSIAAKGVGIEQEKLSDILKDVNDKMGDFHQTGAGPMADFFENIAPKVGLTADNFKNLSSDQVLQKYVKALEDANVSQSEMTFYMEAIASDATGLVPIFQNSGAAIDEVAARASALGLSIDQNLIAKSREASKDFAVISAVLKSKFQAALIKLVPAMTQVAQALVPMLEKMASGIEAVASWFSKLSPSAQRFSVIAGVVAAALGPVLATMGLMVTAMAPLGAVFALISAPVLAVVAAIAAVAAGVYAVYRNWSGISAWFGEKWAAVKAKFSEGWAKIKAVYEKHTPEPIKKHWRDMAEFYGGIWKGVASAFGFGIGVVKDLIAGEFSPEKALAGWNRIRAFFLERMADVVLALDEGWQNVKASVAGWADDFLQVGRDIIDGLKAGIQEKWQGMQDWFGNLFSGLKSTAEDEMQIKSPSRVFKTIGGQITEGLRLGLVGGSQGVEGAMVDLTGKLSMDGVQGELAKITSSLSRVGQTGSDAFGQIGAAIGEGIKSGKGFRGVLENVASSMSRLLLQQAQAGIKSSFAKSSPGIGSFLSSALGSLVGFKDGGSFNVGGAGGIDSQLVAFKASPNETVSITKPGQTFGGAVQVALDVFVRDNGTLGAIARQAGAEAAAPVAIRVHEEGMRRVQRSRERS